MEKPHLTIALIDDDSSVLKAVSRLLRSLGYAVAAFHEPIEFLHYAAVTLPLVAVVDVRMPDMNGFEVQAQLRQTSPTTEVIFLTSQDDPSVRDKALSQGAIAYLYKPADGEELLTAIESAIHGKRSAKAA